MKISRRHLASVSTLILIACLGIAGCAQTSTPSAAEAPSASATPDEPIELTVSVAASVQDAMKEVQAAYQETAPNVTIVYNFGSSGSLAQQIAQGAPVDAYLSAAPKWMDDLAAQGEIVEGSRKDLLLNSLVLIAPKAASGVTGFADLATDKVSKIAIGEPASVPAGEYAKESLTALNLFEAVQPKLVLGKDVRQVLAYVETGDVDAGLVYATDARISDQVRGVTNAPAETYSPIVYPVAALKGEDAEAAQAFINFLSTDEAIAIFEEYGFTVAE